MDRRICVYEAGETDFAGNGLGTVNPVSCVVHWEENAEYSVELEHLVDDESPIPKYERLCRTERVLVVPVPEAPSMRLRQAEKQTSYERVTYAIATRQSRLRLRAGPGTNYSCLGYYAKGGRVTLIAKTNASWYEVTAPDGKHGWMAAQYLSYVGAETIVTKTASAEIVRGAPMRPQPFDIYAWDPGVRRVSVRARHVFWRLAENMVCSLSIQNMTAAQAVSAVFAAAENQAHGFNWYCDDTEPATIDEEITGRNIVDILLGEKGICETYGLKLLVDWFDIFLVKQIGEDRGVQLRCGKNVLGLDGGYSLDQVVTRVIPVGQTKDGKPLYRSGARYLQSPNEGLYTRPRYGYLRVDDARVGDKMTVAQALAAMDKAAQAELDAGCDLPDCSISVEMTQLRRDPAYAAYAALETICPGDVLALFVPDFAMALSVRNSAYDFDAITQRYDALTVGSPRQNLSNSGVTSRQLGSRAVTGSKLAEGAVNAAALRDEVVSARHVQAQSIGAAHMNTESFTADTAFVGALSAQSISAITAHINAITASDIDTNELSAALAHLFSIVANNIRTGTITADALDAVMANLVTVQAATGEFDLATVRNLISSALTLQQGQADSMYITNLAITSANLLNATVGKLVVRGTDGKYYEIGVGSNGVISTAVYDATAAEIAEGETTDGRQIVSDAVNAQSLTGQTVKAAEAILGAVLTSALTAGQITANDALLASASIPMLYTTSIKALGDTLDISANESIRFVIGAVDDAKEAAADAQTAADAAKDTADYLYTHSGQNLIWGLTEPSVDTDKRASLNGVRLANGNGTILASGGTLTPAEHGYRETATSAARPRILVGSNTYATQMALDDPLMGLEPGKTYTISGDGKFRGFSGAPDTNTTTYYWRLYIYWVYEGATAYTSAITLKTLATITPDKRGADIEARIEATFTVPDNAVGLYLSCNGNDSNTSLYAAGDYVEIANLKIEEGDKATYWTPAPEDAADATAAAKSAADAAQTTANAAQTSASAAQSTADGAASTASAAQTAASTAQSAADYLYTHSGQNLIWGLTEPSTVAEDRASLNGVRFQKGDGTVAYSNGTFTAAEHGYRVTATAAARPRITIGSATSATQLACDDPLMGLEPGKSYTISGDGRFRGFSAALESNSATYYWRVYAYWYLDGATGYSGATVLQTIDTITPDSGKRGADLEGRVEATFTVPDDAIAVYFMCCGNSNTASLYAAGDYVEIANLKIEEGDKATYWTPAPEDAAEATAAAQASADAAQQSADEAATDAANAQQSAANAQATADDAVTKVGALNRYIDVTREDGMRQRVEGSAYSTLVNESGFHIEQNGERIASFQKRMLAAEELRVGPLRETPCIVMRRSSDGGMIFVRSDDALN